MSDGKVTRQEDGRIRVEFRGATINEYLKDTTSLAMKAGVLCMLIAPFDGGVSTAIYGGIALLAGIAARKLGAMPWKKVSTDVPLPDHGTAHVDQHGSKFQVTLPKGGAGIGPQFSAYAFETNDAEEFIAEGVGEYFRSADKRTELQRRHPDFARFIENHFGHIANG